VNLRSFLLGSATVAWALAQPMPQPESARAKPPAAPVRTGTPQAAALKSPGKAVLLSLLLPGGGQVYTGCAWKTALIAPSEVTLGCLTVREHVYALDALSAGDDAAYVRHRDRRTVFLWWTGAVVAFSMADAYVSAQMYGFDREIRFTMSPQRAGIVVGI